MESIRLRAGSGGVPARTGQATGYSASGAVVSCAGSGQYVELQEGVAQTFTDNGDGTISDDVTGAHVGEDQR